MSSKRTFVDKCFKDADGRIVLGQRPNYPIIIWFITVGLRFLPLGANVDMAVAFIGDCFLFLWAWWEITSGVNYFRRALGAIILALLVMTRLVN